MKYSGLIIFILLIKSAVAQVPTFNGDIASIVFNNCVVCHRPGNIAPFPLTNYNEVTATAFSLLDAINNRKMPPWMPDPNYSHLNNERVLSEIDIQKINTWVMAGMPEGDTLPLPALPVFSETGEIGIPDIQLALPQYTLTTAQDEYRSFVIPTGFTQDKFMRAFEFMAGNKEVDHHAEIFWDTTGTCHQLDLNDSLPGYVTSGSTIGTNFAHLICVWVPGSSPFVLPGNFGFKIPAGADIVIQMHYRGGGQGLIDSSRINIFIQQNAAVREVKTIIKNHPGPGFLNPPFFIPADSIKIFYAADTLSNAVSFLGIMPHMHQVGTHTITYAVTPAGDTAKVISIPNWNFYWQNTYMYQKLQVLPVGSVFYTNSTYDNTSNNLFNPNNPPHNIWLGFATNLEMFLTAYYYVNYLPGDENIILDSSLIHTTSIEPEKKNAISLFPNPNAGDFTVSFFSEEVAAAVVSIYSVEGKKVKTLSEKFNIERGANQLKCNTLLADGIYFLKIAGEKLNVVQKIIVCN